MSAVLLAHALLFGGLGETGQLQFDLGRRAGLTCGVQVSADLVDDAAVAAVELGVYDVGGIGVRQLVNEAHPFGRPQPEHPVAARRDPEPQFLIVLETGLKTPFALVEDTHDRRSIPRAVCARRNDVTLRTVESGAS
jgi:hypothetical protein